MNRNGKRKEKGTASILSLILMMMITLALTTAAWMFMSGVLTSKIGSSFSIVYNYMQTITIVNDGSLPITSFDRVTVDGNEVTIIIDTNNIIYQEDFNDGVADGWTVQSGTWVIDSFAYRGDGTIESAESSVDLDFNNTLIEYDLRFGVIKPTDVILLMDTSLSMQEEIDDAKTAANSFIDQLGSGDRAGEVWFNTSADLDKGLTFDHNEVKIAIDNLDAGGFGTAMDMGIDAANDELITNGRPEASAAEIMLTDGQNNCGSWPTPPPDCDERLDAAVQEAVDNNIIIYTIGLGSGVNEVKLQDIADATGGEYFFAPAVDDLQSIYQQIASELILPGVSSILLKNSAGEALIQINYSIDPDNVDLIDPQTEAIIDSQSIPFDFNIWYHVQMFVSNNKAVLAIDNNKIVSGETSRGFESKSILALGSENSFIFFDNIVVKDSTINAGTLAIITILDPLDPGAYVMRICTQTMCQPGYLTIV